MGYGAIVEEDAVRHVDEVELRLPVFVKDWCESFGFSWLFVVKVQGHHWRGHWGAARAEATKKTATTKTKPTTLRPAIVLGCRRRQLEEWQYSKKKIKLDHRRYVGRPIS